MLPSTDHMIQQYGTECLGTCGKFWFRLVQDDPEKVQAAQLGYSYMHLIIENLD
jgi:hypothetical protein